MKIEFLEDGYTKHGCSFLPTDEVKLAIIEYSLQVTNHNFNGAYGGGGLFEWQERAKSLMQEHYPNAQVLLAIPDLVFAVPSSDLA